MIRRALLLIIVAINIWLWAVPDSIVELVARGRHVLLGRYSVEHFSLALAVLLISLPLICILAAPQKKRRQRALWWSAAALMLALSLLATDILLRLFFDDTNYVHVGELRLRPANLQVDVTLRDIPLARRTLPNLKPGYPDTRVIMTVDGRGFRNPEAVEQADILLLGDSFTEGSRVTDDRTWATQLRSKTGLTIYNLAGSGDDPQKYLAKLRHYGLSLNPRLIVVGIYEGNDFRRSRPLTDSIEGGNRRDWLKRVIKFSPLRIRLRRLLTYVLGPINSTAEIPGDELLEWLPYAVSGPEGTAYYSLSPRNIAEANRNLAQFSKYRGWLTARDAISEIKALSDELGARLVVVFMPSKPHVTLPLVLNGLDPEKLLQFTLIDPKRMTLEAQNVSDAGYFIEQLTDNLDTMERVVAKFCKEAGIDFLSLTGPLRASARRGQQPYFTYDQHWSPVGHDITADIVGQYIQSLNGTMVLPRKF